MNPTIFSRRVALLKKSLSEQSSVIVLRAYAKQQYQGDMEVPFLQEANFLWLTGIDQPNWWVIITPDTEYLVAPSVDMSHQIFNGAVEYDAARTMTGVAKIVTTRQAHLLLRELADRFGHVYTLGKDPYSKYYDFSQNPSQAMLARTLKRCFKSIEDCRPQILALRSIKSSNEVGLIKEAVAVSLDSFRAIHEEMKRVNKEYEIEARLNGDFRRTGADGHAYAPIVAAGLNACTLHYNKNNSELPKNGLVLIDAGARFNGYCADITRTYAIGEPSSREKAVHAAVQKAHFAIIDLIRPGVTFKDYQDGTDTIMKEALRSLGLLNSPADYRKYFPHAISHGLGIDVHESLGGYKEFQPGMVLTVEPGIYIPEEGIGVRIEDDILVTETGNENLSAALSTDL
jgi:Xaa-Pro aminopeptidase